MKEEHKHLLGRRVTYTPRDMPEHRKAYGESIDGKLTHYMEGGEKASDVFNQPMLCIDAVDYWIPLSNCFIHPKGE